MDRLTRPRRRTTITRLSWHPDYSYMEQCSRVKSQNAGGLLYKMPGLRIKFRERRIQQITCRHHERPHRVFPWPILYSRPDIQLHIFIYIRRRTRNPTRLQNPQTSPIPWPSLSTTTPTEIDPPETRAAYRAGNDTGEDVL